MTDVLAYLEKSANSVATYSPNSIVSNSVRFQIEKSVLLPLLDKVAMVVPAKADSSVIKNFQFEVKEESLRITGTDKQHIMSVATKMFKSLSSGTILIPAKTLLDILRSISETTVDIEAVSGSIFIVADSASWELRSLEGLKFPAIPSLAEAKPVKVDRYAYVLALSSVKYAVAKDSARAGLKVVNLKANKMTACDGVRFQQATVAAPAMQIAGGSIELLLKILSSSAAQEFIFAEIADYLIFRIDTTVLLIEKPKVNFPHAEQLFLRPALTNDQELKISKKDLVSAIKKVRLCADEDTSAIALKLSKGQVEVSTRDQGGNKASESVSATWKGKARTLIIHHKYLLDLLSVNDVEECVFKLGEDSGNKKSPLLLHNESAGMTGVVQQMLLGSLTGYRL